MLKKLFSKFRNILPKKLPKKIKRISTVQEVSFTDLAGTSLILEIRTNGNDTMLVLTDKKSQLEFLFDQELATLLSVLIQSYAVHKVFPDLDEE